MVPQFELLDVGTTDRGKNTGQRLWRRYTLSVEGFRSEILEVFPDRTLLDSGAWLDGAVASSKGLAEDVCRRPWTDASKPLLRILIFCCSILLILLVSKDNEFESHAIVRFIRQTFES